MAYSTSLSINVTHPDRNHNLGDPDPPNESTPLLADRDEEVLSSLERAPTPLPIAQLGALMAVRVIDPIAYQQIFPYINQLLVDMHVAVPDRVGVYSGLVESAYSFAQVFSVYYCGRISDVVGRRPVVFTGLIGTALASTTFGLSTSFAGVVASRSFGGLVAGNIAVIHSILIEITDDTNQDLAVPIYGLTWQLGTVIGPLIGGTLENAATRYPQYFSWDLFVEHPYLPPCIVSAACALIAAMLAYMLIEETLPSKRKHAGHADTHASPRASSGPRVSTNSDEARPASMMELLSMPAIRALTISGFVLNFLILAFDVVFTLFCYAPIDAGGMGLEPSTIGNTLAFAGFLTVLLRTPAMPYILRHFDYAVTYNVCMQVWPFAFGLLPFLNLLARAYPPSTWTTISVVSVLLWAGLLVPLTLSKIGMIANNMSMLLIKQYAPSSSLGISNGLVQFSMCVGRAVAPLVVSTLFTGTNGIAWAKRWGVGGLWAVVMIVVAVAGARVTRGLRSYSTEGN